MTLTYSDFESLDGFPGVHMAVDIAILTVSDPDESGERTLQTLLVRRDEGFQADKWMIPGRFVREHQRLAESATICLAEKAGIIGFTPRQLLVLDDPKRDPRGWTMSVGHVVAVPYKVALEAVSQDPEHRTLAIVDDHEIRFSNSQAVLPLDHQKIIDAAIDYLRSKYFKEIDPRNFLDEIFTMPDLFEVHCAVLGREVYSRDAFRRTFERYLEPLGETRSVGVGKPAMLYRKAARVTGRAPRRISTWTNSSISKG
ncbi:MAG: hypothetical protein RLZZ330_5 [Actinomycetota bacterium]|jgi:ADP-ribose pyrophosphatase YjhB (NUDIX family)